ncbi:MAG: response regulator [Candidatus Gastranaerophilales bacterium]|nr:response regulator [Candidatus Gastranaerophilales bacterium]
MEISKEQFKKIIELSGLDDIDINNCTLVDFSRAIVEIERKLNFFDTSISFDNASDCKNVLIVDDLELSIYQLNQLLKKIGIHPSVARSKDEAIAELRKKSLDFILIDLFLPDSKDGFALLEEAVKVKNETQPNLKILVMSGTDDKSVIDNCYKLGADGYIAKSEMWHTEILKYMNTILRKNDNADFVKISESANITTYTVARLNSKQTLSEITEDINSTVLVGCKNIILNLEQVTSFDPDNAYVFAEIYKICAGNEGVFAIANPSEKVKKALSFAYLDGIIPLFYSVSAAINYIENKA